jgi:hypothetical protein
MTAFAVFLRREWPVALFTGGFTFLFTIVGLVRQETFLWIYLPALLASIGIVFWVDRRWGPVPSVLLWMLSIWAGMHLAGGLAANPTGETEILYGMWIVDGVLRWDQLVHGFGIAAATAVFVVAARETTRPLLWGFVWGQVPGLVNETVENVFAHFVDGSNVGDAVNTAWDLGWHLIGGIIAVLAIRVRGIPAVVVSESPS